MEEKVKILKENMNSFEQWGNPKYKGFLEHVLKHYPNISEKQLKTIDISYSQLQKFLSKGKQTSNFNYNFEANQIFEDIEFDDSVYDDIISEHCLELKSRYTSGLTEEEIRDIIFHENYDSKYLVHSWRPEVKVKNEDFYSDEEDSPITKVISSFGFNYCDYIAGVLCLIETKDKKRYIAGAGDDYMSEDRLGEYFGKADNITKEDFEKNIKYLIKGYLLKESWINGDSSNVEERAIGTIHVNSSVKFLKKLVNKDDNQAITNKFEYDFSYKVNDINWHTLIDDYEFDFENNNFVDPDEMGNKKREILTDKIYETSIKPGKLKINKKKLIYFDVTNKMEEDYLEELQESAAYEYNLNTNVVKILSAYEFSYYGCLLGFIMLYEDDKKHKYLTARLDSYLEGEGNNYNGKADGITKEDFNKNIDYLITEYLSEKIGCY